MLRLSQIKCTCVSKATTHNRVCPCCACQPKKLGMIEDMNGLIQYAYGIAMPGTTNSQTGQKGASVSLRAIYELVHQF